MTHRTPTLSYKPLCAAAGINPVALKYHFKCGNVPPLGADFDNRGAIVDTSRQVRFTPKGGLYLIVAMRLISANIPSGDAFSVTLSFSDLGTSPETWGDDPPEIKPWNHRAPGKIFAAGKTWMVVDPRRHDDLTGLPLHRVICTADPALSHLDSLLSAPEAGLVTGDPQTLVIVDISAIGHDLCAKLSLDPAEHLITPAPEGGWS